MRKRCVIKPEADWNTGDRAFWYDHPETGEKDYDETHVTIYNHPTSEEWILKCHISKIIPVSEDMLEVKWGSTYLKDEFSQFK